MIDSGVEQAATVPPVSLVQRLRFVQQLACGLHTLHSNGILHRDVKPANVLINADGDVSITDLGLARRTTNPVRIMTHEVRLCRNFT